MMNKRVGRTGVLALAVLGLLAASWVLPPAVHRARRLCPVRPDGVAEAGAYASFARRYGVSCSVCHLSYPQLNVTGYKFRTAGYRMPDEIGNDAKWANWGDNTSIKVKEDYKVAGTKGNATQTAATNGFVNGGIEWFPWEGAVGKYTAVNSEIDFSPTPATVGVSNLNLDATFPVTQDSFVTTRVGLISQFQGYGASDRGVGAVSPSFLPTPSQVAPGAATSFTYNGFNKAGEGIEVAYNWKDTHVSAQITNGYNSFKSSTQQGEDNHFKDFSVFVNQLIGENAIAAAFYQGTSGYSFTGNEASGTPFSAQWYDHYMRGVLYGTMKFLPSDKLDLLVGFADGVDHAYDNRTNSSSDQFHSMGWFATLQTVQPVLSQHLTTALSYGTNRASTSTAGNRVSDVTLAFAVPVENSKFDVSFQGRRTQAFGSKDVTAHTVQAEWEFMF